MKIKFLIPIVVLVVGIVAGATFYLKVGPFAQPAANAPAPTPGSVEYLMGERILNLQDKAGYRYLKIRVSLEFLDPNHKAGELKGDALKAQEAVLSDEVDRYSASMDDFLTTTLTTKTASELLTAEGKEQLRDQLLTGFKARVPEPSLRAVYFTEFVIQ